MCILRCFKALRKAKWSIKCKAAPATMAPRCTLVAQGYTRSSYYTCLSMYEARGGHHRLSEPNPLSELIARFFHF